MTRRRSAATSPRSSPQRHQWLSRVAATRAFLSVRPTRRSLTIGRTLALPTKCVWIARHSQWLVYHESCLYTTLHRGVDVWVEGESEAQAEASRYRWRVFSLQRGHWELLVAGPIGSYTEVPWEIRHIHLLSFRSVLWELHGALSWEIRHVHLASSRERKALSSSHYSSLPPCSEMILQEVTLDGKRNM